MKRRLFVTVLMLLYFSVAKSQTRDAQHNSMSLAAKPTPNTGIVSTSGYNVNYQTGTVDVSLPIYTIQVNSEFSLPISLNYNTGGIKVSQRDAGFGLGWNLGGVFSIMREVRGLPDEYGNLVPTQGGFRVAGNLPEHQFVEELPNRDFKIKPSWLRVGIITAQLRKELNEGDLARNSKFVNLNSSSITNMPADGLIGLGGRRVEDQKLFYYPFEQIIDDAEPDLYHFSIGRFSGKCYFDPLTKEIVTIPKSNLKIIPPRYFFEYHTEEEYVNNPVYFNSKEKEFSSWTIIDESGNKFTFSEKQNTYEEFEFYNFSFTEYKIKPRVSNTRALKNGMAYKENLFTSAWYISSIESFPEYSGHKITFSYDRKVNKYKEYAASTMFTDIDQNILYHNLISNDPALYNQISDLVTQLVDEPDLSSSCYNVSTPIISKIHWRSSLSSKGSNMFFQWSNSVNEMSCEKIEIKHESTFKIIEFNYSFFSGFYFDGPVDQLPSKVIDPTRSRKLAAVKDYGVSMDNIPLVTSFMYYEDNQLPTYDQLGDHRFVIDQLDYRDAWGYCKFGLTGYAAQFEGSVVNNLKKILQPSGAQTEFVYDLHKASKAVQGSMDIGGCRIKEIRHYDLEGLNISFQKDEFEYLIPGTTQTSGTVNDFPQVSDYLTTIDYDALKVITEPDDDDQVNIQFELYKQSKNNLSSSVNYGEHVLYQYVTHKKQGKGKTVFQFTCFNDHPNQTYTTAKYLINAGAVSLLDTYTYLRDYYSPKGNKGYERSLLLNKKEFSENGTPVRENIYDYDFRENNTKSTNAYRVVKSTQVQSYITQYQYLSNLPLLEKLTEINYLSTGDLINVTNFTYNNTDQLIRSERTNSDLSISAFETDYVKDKIVHLTTQPNSFISKGHELAVLKNMEIANAISQVTETRSFRNQLKLESVKFLRNSDFQIKQKEDYRRDSEVPVAIEELEYKNGFVSSRKNRERIEHYFRHAFDENMVVGVIKGGLDSETKSNFFYIQSDFNADIGLEEEGYTLPLFGNKSFLNNFLAKGMDKPFKDVEVSFWIKAAYNQTGICKVNFLATQLHLSSSLIYPIPNVILSSDVSYNGVWRLVRLTIPVDQLRTSVINQFSSQIGMAGGSSVLNNALLNAAVEIKPDNKLIKIRGLRIVPTGFFAETYAYDATRSMIFSTNLNERNSYYSYDGFGRLNIVKDHDKNIVNAICYRTNGETGDCFNEFSNVQVSQNFRKVDCSAGFMGEIYTYIVPAGKYTSTISQNNANEKAWQDIIVNGQEAANFYGSCVPIPADGTLVEFESPVMEEVYYETIPGSPVDAPCVSYWQETTGYLITKNLALIPTVKYMITYWEYDCAAEFLSDDNESEDLLLIYDQVIASFGPWKKHEVVITNVTGDIRFFPPPMVGGYVFQDFRIKPVVIEFNNAEKFRYFIRNNCSSGLQGASYKYIVPSGKYKSEISQADADSKAMNEIALHGQNDANLYASCKLTTEGNLVTFESALADFPYETIPGSPINGPCVAFWLEPTGYLPSINLSLSPSVIYVVTYWEYDCPAVLMSTSSSVQLLLISDTIVETRGFWKKHEVRFTNVLGDIEFWSSEEEGNYLFQDFRIREE